MHYVKLYKNGKTICFKMAWATNISKYVVMEKLPTCGLSLKIRLVVGQLGEWSLQHQSGLQFESRHRQLTACKILSWAHFIPRLYFKARFSEVESYHSAICATRTSA